MLTKVCACFELLSSKILRVEGISSLVLSDWLILDRHILPSHDLDVLALSHSHSR